MKIAGQWFQRIPHEHGVTQLVEPHVHPLIRGNVWHVRGRDRDLVVDTGVGIASVSEALSDILDRSVVCVATHVHYDHVGCLHEFDIRLMHPLGAVQMKPDRARMPLRWSAFDTGVVETARTAGYQVGRDELVEALPGPDFDIDAFTTKSAGATGEVVEGSMIDLGDRQFLVLELPGHTPDSIGLWESDTRTLFSGDAIYDGPLIDFLPESDTALYMATMRRLKDLPVATIHAGHAASFERARMIEIVDAYVSEAT